MVAGGEEGFKLLNCVKDEENACNDPDCNRPPESPVPR